MRFNLNGQTNPAWSDAGHYAPVLQCKSGEMRALQEVPNTVRRHLTPIVRVVGPKEQDMPLKPGRVRGWVNSLQPAVLNLPFFLDTLRVSPCRPVQMTRHQVPLLSYLHRQARRRGLEFIPVINFAHCRSQVLTHAIAQSVHEDQRGMCLRFSAGTIIAQGTSLIAELESAFARIAISDQETDLWIDFGYLDPDRIYDPESITEWINKLTSSANWLSVIMTATSIPQMMGEIKAGSLGEIPRREWELWTKLRNRGLTRVPIFGDFAVQHPLAPYDGGGPGMRANIRYTLNCEFLVARGLEPYYIPGSADYIAQCQKLIDSQRLLPRGFSWGDRYIHDCAAGEAEPGSHALWRGVGTSHHLALVLDQLREFSANIN